jgi:hypothetical protein
MPSKLSQATATEYGSGGPTAPAPALGPQVAERAPSAAATSDARVAALEALLAERDEQWARERAALLNELALLRSAAGAPRPASPAAPSPPPGADSAEQLSTLRALLFLQNVELRPAGVAVAARPAAHAGALIALMEQVRGLQAQLLLLRAEVLCLSATSSETTAWAAGRVRSLALSRS